MTTASNLARGSLSSASSSAFGRPSERQASCFCCGHEYTETNARFALTIEPENKALRAEAEAAAALRAAGRPTVPTTLAQELSGNPYFRARDLAEFTARREAKNHFR